MDHVGLITHVDSSANISLCYFRVYVVMAVKAWRDRRVAVSALYQRKQAKLKDLKEIQRKVCYCVD